MASLQPASASELDVLLRRCLSLAYPASPTDSTNSAEDSGAVGTAAGGGAAWIRTSRGSRPASAEQRTEAILRRVLQRAQVTAKELRALHGALRQVERQLNDGDYFNG